MLVILLMVCWTDGSNSAVLNNTGIFSPLTIETAARRDDGAFFVFDRFEHNIWLYFPGGNDRQKVARKGPGPGELERTNKILLFDGKLYVFSAGSIQIFDRDGAFLRSIRLPPGLLLEKTATGWVGQKQRLGRVTHELAFYNEDLEREAAIVSWEEERPRMTRIQPGEPRKVPVFPEMGNFKVSADGAWLYYRVADRATIHRVSTHTGEKAGSIVLEKRHPFNEAVGQAVIDKLASNSNDRITGVFPELYPFSNGFHWDPRNYFLVAQWQGDALRLLRFHPDGKPAANPGFTPKQLKRLIAYEDGHFFISYQDPEREDMGIRRVPENEIEAFFERFPLED